MALDPVALLRASGPLAASTLAERMGVSRATLSRAVRAAENAVIVRGRARRTRYAARRALRGAEDPLPLYQIDRAGTLHQIAELDLVYPDGTAARYLDDDFGWPFDEAMADGWFDGLPYPLQDMRPQGFLGRNFARHHAALLQVNEDPNTWSDDDVLYALSLLGDDAPGDLLLGEPTCRRWLAHLQHLQQAASGQAAAGLHEDELAEAYPRLAAQALALGVAGSSAGGEFPKFTTLRQMADGTQQHVLVKFSGADQSPGTERWADLLICEHLAGLALQEHLGIASARSRVHVHAGRVFLEVDRFDRHGALGRSPMVSWFSLNNSFVGAAGRPWAEAVRPLAKKGWVSPDDVERILRVWLFGQLIANTDMHDGNLSFIPTGQGADMAGVHAGFHIAPIYDMLPMAYAPVRGVELPPRQYQPQLPLPAHATAWQDAARAALVFWEMAARDGRVSEGFRAICRENAESLLRMTR